MKNAVYTKAHKLRPGEAAWREIVNARLREGYGVEDIAIWLACDVRWVRAHVLVLRHLGVLARWWPKSEGSA